MSFILIFLPVQQIICLKRRGMPFSFSATDKMVSDQQKKFRHRVLSTARKCCFCFSFKVVNSSAEVFKFSSERHRRALFQSPRLRTAHGLVVQLPVTNVYVSLPSWDCLCLRMCTCVNVKHNCYTRERETVPGIQRFENNLLHQPMSFLAALFTSACC